MEYGGVTDKLTRCGNETGIPCTHSARLYIGSTGPSHGGGETKVDTILK